LCKKSREYNNHYTAVAESTKLGRQPQYSFNVIVQLGRCRLKDEGQKEVVQLKPK